MIARLRISAIVAGLFFLANGLWEHDWRVIVAAVILVLIGPLVAAEARAEKARRRQRDHFNRLWRDDDLSDSA